MDKTEELCKMCYELCEKADFNDYLLDSKVGFSKSNIKKYARQYMIDYLNLSKEELDKFFMFFLGYQERNLLISNKEIISEMDKINFVSKENLRDIEWITENLKNKIYEFCFFICNKFNWKIRDINEYCVSKSIEYERLRRFAKEYRESNLDTNDNKKIEQQIRENASILIKESSRESKKNSPGKFATLFNMILSLENDEEIAKIIQQSGIEPSCLKHQIVNYVLVHRNGSESDEKFLKDKIERYAKYLSEERRKTREYQKEQEHKLYVEQNISNAKIIISNYLIGAYEQIDDYCSGVNISKKAFYEALELIKENDIELFEKYLKKQQELGSKRYAILLSKNKKIIELMKNGVEENGEIREFNLVDYYEKTNMDLDIFLDSIKGKINPDEYRIIKIFISKHKNDKPLTPFDIAQIYKTKTIVGIEYDGKGRMIEGTGRELTKEEKQSIIFYLNSKNIPVTRKTYEIVKNKLILGKLDKNENKTK